MLYSTHFSRLEAETIHIMREVAAEAENPVMLYSVGKDSAVMLHLAKKAFIPRRRRFPCCTSILPGNFRICIGSETRPLKRRAWSFWSIRIPRPRRKELIRLITGRCTQISGRPKA